MNFFIWKKVAFVIRIGNNWIAIKFTTVKLKCLTCADILIVLQRKIY